MGKKTLLVGMLILHKNSLKKGLSLWRWTRGVLGSVKGQRVTLRVMSKLQRILCNSIIKLSQLMGKMFLAIFLVTQLEVFRL